MLPFLSLNILIDLHWNEEEKMYCDLNVNDEGG